MKLSDTKKEEGPVFPSEEAQALYPLEDYPCKFCSNQACGPPRLVDRPSEFYWHHWQFRMGCKRFGTSESCGARPRKGTAVAVYNLREIQWQKDGV